MARYCCKFVFIMTAIFIFATAGCGAFQLLAPTEGQAVRESMKILIPSGIVSDGGFISVRLGDKGAEKFVAAISKDTAKPDSNNNLAFFWNTKSPYFEPNDPVKPCYFKDGRYPLTVQIHDASSKVTDSASVTIELRNRVARTNPAPGVKLFNSLSFGQVNHYRVNCNLSVFEVVNNVGLPILGGMSLSGESVVIQSVEDARPGGEYLIRLREDDRTWVAAYGVKKYIYADQEFKPQLYRLINKHGNVISENMFAKQAKYEIMDILPTLPTGVVKEGDSWPDKMTLKIEGITPMAEFNGNATLDSFEWESGRECAKIKSTMSSPKPITLANGKIKGIGPVNAEVTTYFAYKTGRLIKRNVKLTFDALINMSDSSADQVQSSPASSMANSPFGDDMADPYDDDDMPRRSSGRSSVQLKQQSADSTNKKGKAELNIVVRLEK